MKRNGENGFIGAGIVNVILGIIITLIALRFAFRVLGANPTNPLANFIYSWSQPFVAPFSGLFNIPNPVGEARFELSALIALLFYGIIAAAVASMSRRH